MNKIVGKNGVTAELVQYSCDKRHPENKIMTVNVKYGLITHAEFLRHRLLSRGVKSNRAIPMKKIREEVLGDPYVPVWFGAAQKGMVADLEMSHKWLGRQVWLKSRYLACGAHWIAEKLGAHKEWANRLLNPWQWVRETITATEWDNLYNLRIHKDAQKDIAEIVKLIHQLSETNKPLPLSPDEWHAPYVTRRYVDGVLKYIDNDGKELSIEEAKRASAARCARSSYDNHDGTSTTYEKDLPLYDMLIESDPKHASPVEHQGTPMKYVDGFEHSRAQYKKDPKELTQEDTEWEDGVTHCDRSMNFWSGNFKGWIQHRQLLNNHTCWKYKK